jgi:hypothetical protein
VSPDGCILVSFGQGCDNCGDDIDLDPGTEVPGTDTPSLLLRFEVNDVEGIFEIDTCCITPVNHLSFVDRNSALVVPSFTKGVITVEAPLENSVVVESKQVLPGATGVRVGVYISNAVEIYKIVLPLEIRSLDGGAFYIPPLARGFNPNGRLYEQPLGSNAQNAFPVIVELLYATISSTTCGGPVSNSYDSPSMQSDAISPDGLLLTAEPNTDISGGWDYTTDVGMDTQGSSEPSYFLLLDVATATGSFEIDTCCVQPGHHLRFETLEGENILPLFTKGTINVGCFCRCHGDPDCNGYLDIVDVVRTINTAFRGLASITDQDCTHERTDVDASEMTNVSDVARMIDVVFGGQSEDAVFVDPCAN